MFTRCLRQSLPSVTRTQRPFTSTAVALAKKKKKKAAALLADEDDYDSELFGLPSEDNDLSSDLFSNSAASTLDAQLPKKARPTAEERLNLRTQLFAKQFAFFQSRIEGAVATGGNPEKIREDIPHVQLRKGNESTVQDGGGQLRPRMLEELIDLCSNPQELRQITALFPTLRTLVTKNSLSLAHKRVCGQIHGAEKETAPFTENWYKAWIPKKLVVTAGRVGAPDVAVEILTNPLEFHIPSTVPVLRQLLHDVQKVNGNDMDSLKPLIPYITNYLRADPVLSTILLQSLYASAESQIRSIPGAVLRKWAPEFAAGTKVETAEDALHLTPAQRRTHIHALIQVRKHLKAGDEMLKQWVKLVSGEVNPVAPVDEREWTWVKWGAKKILKHHLKYPRGDWKKTLIPVVEKLGGVGTAGWRAHGAVDLTRVKPRAWEVEGLSILPSFTDAPAPTLDASSV